MSTIENKYSLGKKDVNFQKEIKEKLMKLKEIKEHLMKLKEIKEHLVKLKKLAPLKKKRKDFDSDIQKVQEKITLLRGGMSLLSTKDWLQRQIRGISIPQKAIDFFEEAKFEQLQEGAKQIEELNKDLKKYQQIKKEFQKLQSKEKVPFEN
ncbi:hypothetical protein RFI_32724, partial [Reticulomyxa filosa]